MTLRWRAWSLIACLVASTTAAFFALFERGEKVIEQQFSAEAVANPLLAALGTLQRMGLEATMMRELDTRAIERESPDAIVLLNVGVNELPGAVGALEPWIGDGGDLVVALRGHVSSVVDGRIKDRRETGENNVTGDRMWRGEGPPAWERVGKGFAWYKKAGLARRVDSLVWSDRRFQTEFSSAYFFSAHGPWSSEGDCLASRSYGQGRLVILCGSRLFVNWSLGKADHANLLLSLLTGQMGFPVSGRDPRTVWLISHPAKSNLFEWLWDRIALGLVGIAALLLAWLARVAQRFGPITEVGSEARRSIVEHAEASARFVWSQGATDGLLRPLTEDFVQAAAKLHPQFLTMHSRDRKRLLFDVLGDRGLAVAEVLDEMAATQSPRSLRPREFVRKVELLIRARKQL